MRFFNGGRISWAKPMIVVEDSDELVALYLPAWTPIKRRLGLDGLPVTRSIAFAERVRRPWTLGDGVWAGTSVLQLVKPGQARSYWAFWRGAHEEFLAWYVNLQEPLRRSAIGFDTADHVLDIEVEPDLTWRWKDEDEFAEAQQFGLFTPEEAAAIRAEGEAAIAVIEARGWPFADGWEMWRPDPAWPAPTLPDGWDLL